MKKIRWIDITNLKSVGNKDILIAFEYHLLGEDGRIFEEIYRTVVEVEIKNMHRRDWKRLAVEEAWKDLKSYFDGECVAGDTKNIFEVARGKDLVDNTELTVAQELSLQQELKEISYEFHGGEHP